MVTFTETQFCREQNWARFSAPAGPKPGMASVKSHPGWSLLRIHAPATFARPCAAQGSGGHPQLAFNHRRRRCTLPPRMMLFVQRLQPCLSDMRVNLRGGKVGMAEEHLDHTQIGAVVKQVRGEGVAQGVG